MRWRDDGELAVPFLHDHSGVVEDEGHLRELSSIGSSKTGLEVLEAADGSSAIDLLHAAGDKIDVILLDLTLPGASSHEIIAQAANAKPDIRIILTSAHSQEMIADAMRAPQVPSFIRKPFQFGELLNTLRSSLPS